MNKLHPQFFRSHMGVKSDTPKYLPAGFKVSNGPFGGVGGTRAAAAGFSPLAPGRAAKEDLDPSHMIM